MADKPKWKEPCGCWVNEFAYVKICTKHQKEFDELHARAIREKAILDNWDTGPVPNHSRHGTFERLGGPVKWDPYNPNDPENKRPKPKPVPAKADGDLTSMMD